MATCMYYTCRRGSPECSKPAPMVTTREKPTGQMRAMKPKFSQVQKTHTEPSRGVLREEQNTDIAHGRHGRCPSGPSAGTLASPD